MTSTLHQWLRSRKLQNQYFIIRHGESMANVAGLIVSSPENGVNQYGLSEKGAEQVRSSVLSEDRLNCETLIISSDFQRTLETAKIVNECLSSQVPVQAERLLRERFFGELELGDSKDYAKVWASDAVNPDHTNWGVESVKAVLDRLHALLLVLDSKYADKNILLVSHGDILQILQTAFDDIKPSEHRSILHLNTAEIRQLLLSV